MRQLVYVPINIVEIRTQRCIILLCTAQHHVRNDKKRGSHDDGRSPANIKNKMKIIIIIYDGNEIVIRV